MSGTSPSEQSLAASNFRAELERLGLTRADAAKRLGTDEKQVRRWCDGIYNPRLSTLRRWADLCGRTPVWFLESHDDTGARRRAEDVDANGEAA